MRLSLLAVLAAVVVVPASAHARTRPVVDLRTLDAPCRTLVMVPADARTIGPTVDAYISAASCMAITRTRALKLVPGPAAVKALNEAVQPSLVLLDVVIRTGDARARLLAEHAKADLYDGLAVRLESLAPRTPVTAAGRQAADLARQHDELYALARPWHDAAAEGFAEVEKLGQQLGDQVDRDPVLAFDVSDSRFVRSTGVARR